MMRKGRRWGEIDISLSHVDFASSPSLFFTLYFENPLKIQSSISYPYSQTLIPLLSHMRDKGLQASTDQYSIFPDEREPHGEEREREKLEDVGVRRHYYEESVCPFKI